MKEIIVKTQAEFDAIPQDFFGIIKIIGETTIAVTPRKSALITLGGNFHAVLFGNSHAVLRDNSSVELRDNSSVELRDNSSVDLRDNSSAVLWGNSSAVLWDNSSADLFDNSSTVLWNNSSAVLWDNSSAVLFGNSRAVLRDNSSVDLWDNSSADLFDNSSTVLRDNSSAVLFGNSRAVLFGNSRAVLRANSSADLWENSSADLWGNSQATDRTKTHEIIINGNARIVYDPRNIDEYLSFNGLLSDGETCLLYKAVHKTEDGIYKSDHNNRFFYRIGEVAVADAITTDTCVDCGEGIHLSYPAWAVNYGRDWYDLAILELQVKKSEVIVPENGCGKVRAKSAKVIREVPLEECGLLGKIIAKRNKKESEK